MIAASPIAGSQPLGSRPPEPFRQCLGPVRSRQRPRSAMRGAAPGQSVKRPRICEIRRHRLLRRTARPAEPNTVVIKAEPTVLHLRREPSFSAGDRGDRGDYEGKCSFQRRQAGVTGGERDHAFGRTCHPLSPPPSHLGAVSFLAVSLVSPVTP
jgi:hypothetical protein